MRIHSDLDKLAQIRPEERDHYLDLRLSEWGGRLSSDRWDRSEQAPLHFSRVLPVHEDAETLSYIEELILPFPSAPIYGINRKAEYDKALSHRPNMHSMRLLRRPETPPIHRLFILHNGLNEADSLRFYYQLADWMMRQQEAICAEEGMACLVMPFPGHLMHSSFHGPFSETPLSRYLADAGDLFRQFLRYMIGTRWLLSMVADSDAEKWMVGGDLLKPDDRVGKLFKESTELHQMSEKRVAGGRKLAANRNGNDGSSAAFDAGEPTGLEQIEDVDTLLRAALDRGGTTTPDSLRIHVVGYSLGGFVAQSVFFAWPQAVSSCTTICSGGALSALSPTAFAQPEEWQSVLHALRPELTNSILQGRLGDDERKGWPPTDPVNTVAGMQLEQYGYFQRIFEQVFLQEDRSSYEERLSEYGLRMLFVSGGEDPIVPPANILDASPREGTTMLSVAGMTHFLNQDPKDHGDRRETEQRDFWLPEAGGLIARAAIHAEHVHMNERIEAAKLKARLTRPAGEREGSGRSELLSNGYIFEEALDWVLGAVEEDGGWLFLCRNGLPAAFIPPRDFTNWGTALHHHDLRIQRYALGLRHRARMLRKIKDRTTLIVPKQLRHWFVNLSARFEPHSDAPGGRETTATDRARIWREFEREWWPCIRRFDSGNIDDANVDGSLNTAGFASALAAWLDVEPGYLEATHLPDVWIGIRSGSQTVGAQRSRELTHGALIGGVEQILTDLVKARDVEPKQKVVTKAVNRLEEDLTEGYIRIVQISGAEFNPRYRGRVDRSPTAAARLLVRVAAGLVRSDQISQPLPPGKTSD
ncbi:MAG TPA: alpha/beta hydrolase [Solirubrobacterales bacterium]